MTSYEDEPYVNEHQKRAVEQLHKRTKRTAVFASANSEIHAYLTRQPLSAMREGFGPYEIRSTTPLPNCSEFECKVTLAAKWSDVDG